jgi:hypothetical protein
MKRSYEENLALFAAEVSVQTRELYRPRQVEWNAQLEQNRGKPEFTFLQPEQVYVKELEQGRNKCIEILGEDDFRKTCHDLFFDRFDFLGTLQKQTDHQAGFYPRLWADLLLEYAFHRDLPADLPQRIEKRLELIFRNAYRQVEGHNIGNCQGSPNFSRPFFDSFELLWLAADQQEARRVARRVIEGDFNYGPFEVAETVYERKQRRDIIVQRHSYDRFEWAFPVAGLFLLLAQTGELTDALFEKGVRTVPRALNQVGPETLKLNRHATPVSLAVMAQLGERLARKMVQNFDMDWALLLQCYQPADGCWLQGSWYLLQAAHHHARLKLGELANNDSGIFLILGSWARPATKQEQGFAVVQLAHAKGIVPEGKEERAALVAELKKFSPSTLEFLVPVSTHGFPVLCEALGWEKALPLIDAVYVAAKMRGYKGQVGGFTGRGPDATSNTADPNNGVLEVAAVRALLAATGEPLAKKVLELIIDGNKAVSATATLYAAVCGANRGDIQDGIDRRNQTAVKALGLLPLEGGLPEALERYLLLKEFEHESNEFGAERRANERAAVQAALTNLAQLTGHADAQRLEWAMEAECGQGQDPIGKSWVAGECRAELQMSGGEPRLRFYKGEKLLKSAPTAIKDTDHYTEMKELHKTAQQQFRRLKQTFERMMCEQESLSGSDLESLSKLPVARRLLSRLVFAHQDRVFGTYEENSLRPLAGKWLPIENKATLTIAHPHVLFSHQQLAPWQAEIVKREWLQPFKQVFREVYLPTRNEMIEEWMTRISGQQVKAGMAGQILPSRDWIVRSSDTAEVYRLDRRRGLLAQWEFSEPGHYLGELPTTDAGRIGFYSVEIMGAGHRRVKRLTLAEVPPIFFSEVARDADLVISVANTNATAPTSAEVLARRQEAIRLVLEPMRLEGVSLEPDHVRVRGRRANYRISYSGSITREPDHQAILFPAGLRLGDEKLYLPFSDEDDPAISYVVTTTILLANDDQIKDKGLAQALGIELAPTAAVPAKEPKKKTTRSKRIDDRGRG